MKRKIVIAILCAAVSMGTVGCGNSTASAKKTQTQTDKKEDSKSENSEKSSEEKQSRDIFAMDTYMTVTAYGEHASEAVDKAETEIKRLDEMLSTGNENSEVYKLNQNGEAVVSDDTAYLYERSEKIYKQTKGVFDISIYPVMDAWGFTTENYRIPAEDELSALLKNVDASKIQYDKKTKKITLPKNVKIDFGGIAKGYTSSRIMQIYKKCGVTSGLVSLGGNVQLLGAKPDGSAWKVAVESPDEDGNYLGILQAKDKAVITSGGYERYFEKNGKKYHHIIDPATGYPAENGLTSVTIVSDDGTLADGLSTSLFIMGKEKAEKFWKKYSDTNVDVISGATYSSNGIKSAVRDALRQAAVSGNSQSVNTKTEDTSKTEDNTTVKGNFPYKEGIYYGTAEGYNGEIEVAVVLQDKSIKAVLVTKNHDDEKFFNRAMDVVKNIMKKQSTDVDVVSGATYSSNGLINAVKNALKEAEKVTNGQTTEPDKEKADTSELEKVMKEAEELKQEDYTEATYAVLKTRMEDAQKLLDTDKTEISQEDVDQALENLNQALALLEKKDDGEDDTTVYKNGIYEGRALCRPDEDEDFTAYNLTLKVTVRDDKIVAVTDVKGDGDSSNDRYILRAANGTSSKKGVTSQLIEKGNTEGIDAVSGATCTSKAILDACENALLSAKRQ